MSVRKTMLSRAVQYLRSPQGQKLIERGRSKLDTPANRARLDSGAAKLWERTGIPTNQEQLNQRLREMRSRTRPPGDAAQ